MPTERPAQPADIPDVPIKDLRDDFANATKGYAPDLEFDRAFIESKLGIIRPMIRRYSLRDRIFRDEIEKDSSTDWIPPPPGSVAFGAFYLDPFRASWTTGTDLYWEAVCPSAPGGNVTTFLYLTAMNRASKGCEALIAYAAQAPARFKVFDWSLDGVPSGQRWVVDLPLTNLGQYLKASTVGGLIIQTLPIRNVTFFGGGDVWINQVLILNGATNTWDLAYSRSFRSQLSILQSSEIGSWAPILETFQASYAGTSVFGALNTQVRESGNDGIWGDWQPLNSEQSVLWSDGLGFVQLFAEPNHTWAVDS